MNKKNHYALSVNQLTVNYGKTPILWDISLDVPSSKLVGIIGPNGAGKSTFLKTALGLIKPISGQINFFGETLQKMHKRIAYVPQKESVDWDFPITALDLVLMGRYGRLGLFRWPRKADREAAFNYLAMVGMEKFADRQISQLSGGQQQRVFIARALIQEAEIYFMDEPFAGVDVATSQIIFSILQNLKNQGKTIFVVHHDLDSVRQFFDWVILLNMRLIACGNCEDVFTLDMIHRTYGKDNMLLDEAARLSQQQLSGWK